MCLITYVASLHSTPFWAGKGARCLPTGLAAYFDSVVDDLSLAGLSAVELNRSTSPTPIMGGLRPCE